MAYEEILIFLGFVVAVLGAVAIAGARDPNIRRKVTVFMRSGPIESFWVRKKHLIHENGTTWVKFRGCRYHYIGPQYPFSYRLARSFGVRKYIGVQRIYLEGNPSPYVVEEDKRMALLRDTGRMLHNAVETDLPTKLLRPRKVDFLMILLVASVTFFIGFAIGGRI